MSNAKFSIIACIDCNRGIGKNGTLPWKIKEDMDWFKKITVGEGNNIVVMGRNTWESIPAKFRPLKDRINCVITKSGKFPTFDDFINMEILKDGMLFYNPPTIFIIGGGMLYKEAIKYPECEELILTILNDDYDCDTFFPEFLDDWKCVWSEPMKTDIGSFSRWRRK